MVGFYGIKIYNLTLINVGWGKLGLKSLNPSPLHPWCRVKISPYPHPTTFAGWEKPAWGEAERGRAKLPSLLAGGLHCFIRPNTNTTTPPSPHLNPTRYLPLPCLLFCIFSLLVFHLPPWPNHWRSYILTTTSNQLLNNLNLTSVIFHEFWVP